MKALVTGGCGFIGSNLCSSLLSMGWKVHNIDNLSTGSFRNDIKGVERHGASIEAERFIHPYLPYVDKTMQDLYDEIDPDVVFHVAAVPRVSYSVEHPYDTAKTNILSTIRLLEMVRMSKRKVKPRVIYSSSSSIYGGADILPTSEDYGANPKSPYALQKWEGELWCRMYSQLYGIDTVCLRYFNVFGPNSRYGGPYTTVLGAWMYSLFCDKSVRPYLEGDGSKTRDFCYVGNVVEANIHAARFKGSLNGQAFNIAHGQSHSMLQCKEIIESIAGEKIDLEIRPDRVGDVDHTLADITLARTILKYDPWIDFEAQVAGMCMWYKTDYAEEVRKEKNDT